MGMKKLRYGSVCSGIEAASAAWEPLGWEPAWFCEIDPFASALLAHHYPRVPNHGDFTKLLDPAHAVHADPIDVLVGGTPCQDFSVAGLRAGIEGDRGSLTLDFCRLAGVLQPKWVVWENVPGVLSSDGGRAFGSFLGALGELGYGFAWRVLDAQYFGLAQRRKRVFVVGCAGGLASRAGAVLLEPESVRGDPPARRKARETLTHPIASSLGASGRSFSRAGETRGQDPVVAFVTGGVAPPLTATNDPSRSPQSAKVTAQVAAVVEALAFNAYQWTVGDVATPLMAGDYKKVEIGVRVPGVICETTVTQKEIAGPLDAHYYKGPGSRQGGEREYVAHMAFVKATNPHSAEEAPRWEETEVSACINGWDERHDPPKHVVAFSTPTVITLQDTRGMDKKQNDKGWNEDNLAYTVDAMATQGVALVGQLVGDRNDPGVSVQEEIHPPLCANPMSDRAPFIGVMAFDYKQSGGDAVFDMAPTLRATPHANTWANGGGHVGIVNIEHGLHSSGNLDIREVSEPLTASEYKGHSVVLQEEEPMTFDWQAGGGQTGEFHGGTRVYITDPPGRTRALNACKTLAVLQPEQEPMQPQGFDILGTPATQVGKETEVHTPLRARTPGQFENSTVTVVVTEAVAFTTRGREDGLAVESQDELAYALKNPGSGGRTNDRMVATAEAFAFQPRIGRNGRGQPEPISPTLNGADAGATSDMRPCVVQPADPMAFDTYNQSVSEVTHTLRDPNGTLSDAIPAVMQIEPSDIIGFYPTGGTHGVSAIEDRSPTLKLGSGQGGNAPGVCFKASHFTRGKDGAPSEISPPLSADADRGDQDTLVFANDLSVDRIGGDGALAFKAGQSEAAGGTFVTDEFSPTLQAQNNGSTAMPSVLQTTTMAVRRLTPRECERLQGFPTSRELITIRICLDHQNNAADVALSCRKWLNNASPADAQEWPRPVKTVGKNFTTSPAALAPLAVLSVLTNSADEIREILSHGKSIWSAKNAGHSASSPLPAPSVDIAVALAQHGRVLAREIIAGKAGSRLSIKPSSPGRSGARSALKSGGATRENASDAANGQSAEKFTTSHLGRLEPITDSPLATSLCSVLAVISGCIPSETLSGNFSLQLDLETPYTLVPYRKGESSDSNRYRALGNSMAVPCMFWIGARIARVDEE